MKVSTDEIAVIQARLPYTDRRALSQAWFSHLHFACRDDHGLPSNPLKPAPESRSSPASPRGKDAEGGIAGHPLFSPMRGEFPTRCSPVTAFDQASPASVRRRRVDTTLFPLSKRAEVEPASQVSFTLAVSGARVALHVRRTGDTVHVIAVCSARHATLVCRALAQAAASLRAQGERVDMMVRTHESEERI